MKQKYFLQSVKLFPHIIALFVSLLATETQAATFVVNSVGDAADFNTADNICETATAGECTLRAAIEQANATAGTDAIEFSIAPFDSVVKTIAPAIALPNITQAVTIDGYTQPLSMANTNPTTMGINAVLLIELNGAGAGADGLRLLNGGSTVRGGQHHRLAEKRCGRFGQHRRGHQFD